MSDAAHIDERPFDDVRALIKGVPKLNQEKADAIKARFMPDKDAMSSIGELSKRVAWLAACQSTDQPQIERPLAAVFVASHGVAESVIGMDSASGALERVKLLSEGPSGVRALAAEAGAAFKIFELGTEVPSADMRTDAALSEKDCAAAIAFGMEVVAESADIIILGNAGFGSATAAAAIARGLYGGQTEYWAGGQGDMAKRRIDAVNVATRFHSSYLSDPLEVLRRLGGRDIAGMVGAILAARHQHIPVLLDGYVSCAAAAVLHRVNPDAISHCSAAHISAEPAHGAILDRLGKLPILDLRIGVGDGSGGLLALPLLQGACRAAAMMSKDA